MKDVLLIDCLLGSGVPGTRYRARVDLLGCPEADSEARAGLLAHPQVRALLAAAAGRGEQPVRRYNDAGHTLYALGTLADFGLKADH